MRRFNTWLRETTPLNRGIVNVSGVCVGAIIGWSVVSHRVLLLPVLAVVIVANAALFISMLLYKGAKSER